jgi:hypothetical protein
MKRNVTLGQYEMVLRNKTKELRLMRHGRDHRLSINRPTKRGKENSRSDGHKKEMEDYLLACQ